MTHPQKWEFSAPYSLTSKDGLPGVFWLNHNGHSVASFSAANFGSEQACIEAAWRYAYETDVDEVRAADGRDIPLRDYFAGQVLAASDGSSPPEREAEWAYKVADAMLAERDK